jgi:hypothetical protein
MSLLLAALSYLGLALAAAMLAARLLPDGTPLERASATALFVPSAAVALVGSLGTIGALSVPAWWLAVLSLVPLSYSRAALAQVRADTRAAWAGCVPLRSDGPSLVALAVAALVLVLVFSSAGLFEPFAWDALGYHLPIVHDAIQTGTLRVIPTSVVYVNAYPRLVDLSFVGFRLALGDETWIELAQLQYLPLAILSIASIAHRAGVVASRAVAGATLWLAIPVVMLQLPSGYVDVAVASLCLAAFVAATGPIDPRRAFVTAVAAGMLLGSKPSAPPMVAIVLVTMLVRSYRLGRLRVGVGASALALLIGAGKYVENIWAHGNPIWPVELRLGPVLLPGDVSVQELMISGLPTPYRDMGWLGRLLGSWSALPERYNYDMRIGGLGPLFWVLIAGAVGAIVVAWRRQDLRHALAKSALPMALIVVASLTTPGAYWARYTLAVPAALLACALITIDSLSRHARWASTAVLTLAALVGIAWGEPGLASDGGHLHEVAFLDRDDRLARVGLDEQELEWDRAREAVGPGEAFGYDPSYGMPGRLVRRDGRSRVVYLDDAAPDLEQLDAWLEAERVRVVVLSDASTALARSHPERFRERFASAYPSWQPCTVFDVLPR